MPPRVKTVLSIPVSEFYLRHGQALGLKVIGGDEGFSRLISEPAINRPGLALAGFFTYFARKRVQVLGNSEMSYLRKLTPAMRTALIVSKPRNR